MTVERAVAYQRASRTLMASVIPTSAAMAAGFAGAAAPYLLGTILFAFERRPVANAVNGHGMNVSTLDHST